MEEHRPKKLLDQVRNAIRLKHYSCRTEQAWTGRIRRYLYLSGIGRRRLQAYGEQILRVVADYHAAQPSSGRLTRGEAAILAATSRPERQDS